ncbi:hypothetical protein M0802_012237 [Mischocyttarus mexicanus]|nr:hypothetical protein M0802_012237 [Mischocyttarus mexicanus]
MIDTGAELPSGIFAGEALIRNDNSKGFFKISNTTLDSFMFEIPRLELCDFNVNTLPNSGSDTTTPLSDIHDPDQSCILPFINTIFAEKGEIKILGTRAPKTEPFSESSRVESVKALLHLEHLLEKDVF